MENEAKARADKVLGLLKGTGFDKELAVDLQDIDLRLHKIANKTELSRQQTEREIKDLEIKKMEIEKQVHKQQHKLDGLTFEQKELSAFVSSKSNENVDIKPGKTVEDVYVSLRTRGKILKNQASKDAPILESHEKVSIFSKTMIIIGPSPS